MALATQCPHCQTTFRVAHDQLKLRAGLVRCGSCKEIFNGIEYLLRPNDLTQSSAAIFPAGVAAPEPSRSAPSPAKTIDSVTQASAAQSGSFPAPQALTAAAGNTTGLPLTPSNDTDNDPLQRMTLMDFSSVDTADGKDLEQDWVNDTPSSLANPDQPDPLDQAIEDLQRRPWRNTKESDADEEVDLDPIESAEPGFVTRGRRQQRIGRTLRILMGVGSFVLLIGLIIQGTYTFRNQIAAWLPQAAPMLAETCALIGCRIELPAQIDAVSIESSELQALAANKSMFVLNTLLRNRSSTAQAWPNIELTLNDANEKAIARRVFTPRDFPLPPQDLKKGLAANSEQSIKLFFDLSQLKASGYRVYLFYP